MTSDDTLQFKEVYLREVGEHIQKLNENALVLEKNLDKLELPKSFADLLNVMMRSAHTIKGSSAAMGYVKLAYLTHVLEDIFDGAKDEKLTFNQELINEIFKSIDAIESSVENIRANNHENDTDGLAEELKKITGVQTSGIGKSIRSTEVKKIDQITDPDKTIIERIDYIKVPVERLELIMELVEELLIDKIRLENLAKSNPELKDVSRHISKLVSGLQAQITRARLIPLEQVFSRFTRMIRDLAAKQGKKITFEIIGSEIELDRTIIDKIGEPIIHLLRNAVDHGITKEGKIILRAVRESDKVLFSVENNDRSIDFEEVRRIAIDKQVIDSEKAKTLTENDLKSLLLSSRLSTSREITEISGRGVGLSVVKGFVDSLNGSVTIKNLDPGVCITMNLPLTLAIVRAMLVEIEMQKIALPFYYIVRSLRLNKELLVSVGDRTVIEVAGAKIDIINLSSVLKSTTINSDINCDGKVRVCSDFMTIVIIKNEEREVGLVVDRLIRNQEIIVKPLSPLLKNINLFSGSTIIGDGEIVPILNVTNIFNQALSK